MKQKLPVCVAAARELNRGHTKNFVSADDWREMEDRMNEKGALQMKYQSQGTTAISSSSSSSSNPKPTHTVNNNSSSAITTTSNSGTSSGGSPVTDGSQMNLEDYSVDVEDLQFARSSHLPEPFSQGIPAPLLPCPV